MIYTKLSSGHIRHLLSSKLSMPYVFLETAATSNQETHSYLFSELHDVIAYDGSYEPSELFDRMEEYLDKGFWICGSFDYEFGYFLEPTLRPLVNEASAPYTWIGVWKAPQIISHSSDSPAEANHTNPLSSQLPAEVFALKDITPSISREEYSEGIARIKEYLHKGHTYQINYTFKLDFDFSGSILEFYLRLRQNQPTSYLALINTGEASIVSLSPELFFRINNGIITAKPMKGTIKRGVTEAEEQRQRHQLSTCPKTQAENVMIVDLLRNDLGRIAKNVTVSELFSIEQYKTLYQMTSTIEASLKKNISLKDIFTAVFPCGSVTGAPKIKSMQIIKELEKEPRGIYTGAIGYIAPDRESCFNVAIRTITVKAGKGSMGIGGGIVADSIEATEYEEALLKSNFLVSLKPTFGLLESILREKDTGYYLLDLHLKRLISSSSYFGFSLDIEKIKHELSHITISNDMDYKVRLIVTNGVITIEKAPLSPITGPVKVKISETAIDPDNIFLYHKTTNRYFYNQEQEKAGREGFFEVIFFNTRGELTEGTITNIFIQKSEQLYTPPIRCGILDGVLRQSLIKENQAIEKILSIEDLKTADKIFVGNSVRKLIEADVIL
ncbi:MAG: aminodeoxychorismate synthase component I [Candidatus Margulisiibacteriota bacterium]|nr:MAG: aminodeoxychorismate synthase, component I [Candidatus Margulisbacteria bacterium GWD2_39_127]OGI01176.1 MAG: aminodeoxychorismate synthase, component I [Candidatus Margulisbacteria bacterium GWF2_38_17]OGI09811.1 MAG: aminodeoxychorismate synthase, component I [Candidatus Margulisbacteria bacterium GWE2_39_32]PZM78400.1 MAG: aminodeoxychorismate synthase component I [Candidatus Margulisiibacteriota bacterium]HAR62371.1 aminodeoxychorismate synthase component I [Candidatus Margulisiibac